MLVGDLRMFDLEVDGFLVDDVWMNHILVVGLKRGDMLVGDLWIFAV